MLSSPSLITPNRCSNILLIRSPNSSFYRHPSSFDFFLIYLLAPTSRHLRHRIFQPDIFGISSRAARGGVSRLETLLLGGSEDSPGPPTPSPTSGGTRIKSIVRSSTSLKDGLRCQVPFFVVCTSNCLRWSKHFRGQGSQRPTLNMAGPLMISNSKIIPKDQLILPNASIPQMSSSDLLPLTSLPSSSTFRVLYRFPLVVTASGPFKRTPRV